MSRQHANSNQAEERETFENNNKDEDIVCAISSSGKCPYIVQYLKRIIKGVFPANIGRINVQMGEYRDIDKEEGFKNE